MKTEQPDLATLKAGILNELDATCIVGGATYRQCFDMLESQAARIAYLEQALAKARLDLHKAALDLDGSMQRERHLNRYIDNLTA